MAVGHAEGQKYWNLSRGRNRQCKDLASAKGYPSEKKKIRQIVTVVDKLTASDQSEAIACVHADEASVSTSSQKSWQQAELNRKFQSLYRSAVIPYIVHATRLTLSS